MLMVLALMAQVAISPQAMDDAWQRHIALLRDMQSAATVRFGLDPKRPHLGVVLSTREFTGTTKRLTIVDAVLAGSAAQKSGIRPGDFISAIGNREMDTETLKAVSLYLSDWPDVVPLTIQRGSVRRKVHLRRAPVPCLQTVYDKFPSRLWQKRIRELLEHSMSAKREMERNASNPWSPLESARTYEKLKEAARQTLIAIDRQLDPTTGTTCRTVQ